MPNPDQTELNLIPQLQHHLRTRREEAQRFNHDLVRLAEIRIFNTEQRLYDPTLYPEETNEIDEDNQILDQILFPLFTKRAHWVDLEEKTTRILTGMTRALESYQQPLSSYNFHDYPSTFFTDQIPGPHVTKVVLALPTGRNIEFQEDLLGIRFDPTARLVRTSTRASGIEEPFRNFYTFDYSRTPLTVHFDQGTTWKL